MAPDNSIVVKGTVSSSWLSSLPFLSSTSEKLEFENRFQFDLKATIVLMNSVEGCCRHKDFQVVIDPGTGGIYHLDFDRCYGMSSVSFHRVKSILTVAVDLLRQRTGVDMRYLVVELMAAIEPPKYCTDLEKNKKHGKAKKGEKQDKEKRKHNQRNGEISARIITFPGLDSVCSTILNFVHRDYVFIFKLKKNSGYSVIFVYALGTVLSTTVCCFVQCSLLVVTFFEHQSLNISCQDHISHVLEYSCCKIGCLCWVWYSTPTWLVQI